MFRHPSFLLYFVARGTSSFAYQISAVAVGWQIYALTNSAFDLGMIGLVQFVPQALLSFVAGHTADNYDRTNVVRICQLLQAAAAALLAAGSFGGWITVPWILLAVAIMGAARSFESPAFSAVLPGVVPEGMLQRGSAVTAGAAQLATISGPALGGIAYAVSPGAPYVLMAVLWALGGILNGAIKLQRVVQGKEPASVAALFAGVGFVRRNPAILGTISLDLFAVLLGGATALLPIYARDILHTGPWGLGILRGAPAAGALLITVILARHPITRHAGRRMFQAVIVFGIATIVFAVSHSVWVSVVALAVLGAADTLSVVIRVSLVQLATPDDMRGRVGAVNYLFINASNQLGQFESGITAWLFGAMPAALIGGIGTIVVALLWMKLFPTLRDVDRME